MAQSLANIVLWSQRLLGEVLSVGDFAVDLTAGNGYDTLMLAQAVGVSGRVLAFDLQTQALEQSILRLREWNLAVSRLDAPVSTLSPGVSLVHASHAELLDWCTLAPQAIIANLGYLPGGDKGLVTRPETTLKALQGGCDVLSPGGRMAVVVYAEHDGGREEATRVEGFFDKLDESTFDVLRLQVANRPRAPFLLVASKLG